MKKRANNCAITCAVSRNLRTKVCSLSRLEVVHRRPNLAELEHQPSIGEALEKRSRTIDAFLDCFQGRVSAIRTCWKQT